MPVFLAEATEHQGSWMTYYVEVEKAAQHEVLAAAVAKAERGEIHSEERWGALDGAWSLADLRNLHQSMVDIDDLDISRIPDRSHVHPDDSIEDPVMVAVRMQVVEALDYTYAIEAADAQAAEQKMRHGISVVRQFEQVNRVVSREARPETAKIIPKLIDIDAPAPGAM
jgi:hypothetical protein